MSRRNTFRRSLSGFRREWPSRLPRFLWSNSYYRITRGGLLFTLAIALEGAGAAISANNLLFLILAAMLATLLVSGLISRLCLAGLELELLLPPHVAARRPTLARLRMHNAKRWIPSFSIRLAAADKRKPSPTGLARVSNLPPPALLFQPVYFALLGGGETTETAVQLTFTRRGVHSDSTFAVSTRFPFGFLEKTTYVKLRRETLVYPAVEQQPAFQELLSEMRGELALNRRGQGQDFYRIRPYEAVESARNVDWRSTAHTGELQVREFSREDRRTLELFLDRVGRMSTGIGLEHKDFEASALELGAFETAKFESAVECCAYLAWELAESDNPMHVRSQGFDARVPERATVYDVLRFLAVTEPISAPSATAEAVPLPANSANLPVAITSRCDLFEHQGWQVALGALMAAETARTNGL